MLIVQQKVIHGASLVHYLKLSKIIINHLFRWFTSKYWLCSFQLDDGLIGIISVVQYKFMNSAVNTRYTCVHCIGVLNNVYEAYMYEYLYCTYDEVFERVRLGVAHQRAEPSRAKIIYPYAYRTSIGKESSVCLLLFAAIRDRWGVQEARWCLEYSVKSLITNH